MKFEVKRVRNGYRVICLDLEDDNEVVCADDTYHGADDEHDAFVHLLQSMVYHFGPTDGKYSEKRIRVLCIPGYCYEGDVSPEYYDNLLRYYKDLSDAIRVIKSHRRQSLKKKQ